jgi:hypothetical protein
MRTYSDKLLSNPQFKKDFDMEYKSLCESEEKKIPLVEVVGESNEEKVNET